ncbi:MAG: YceI family protein [Anaerolineales bacterium]
MKRTLLILALALPFLLSACGLLQDPQTASGTIEAIPLDLPTDTAVPPTQAAAALEATETPTAEAAAPTEQPAAGGLRVYTIDQTQSQVRFQLDEDLRGQRKTVVGSTDQVAGELAVNLDDLSSAQVGAMQINARTLLTDNNFRNRAIQNEILNTGTYEFITFTPTAFEGLPVSVSPGTEVTFTISGDLTIRDITQPATFQVTAQADSADQISGTATATIQRADFNLNIPSVPNVANVEEEVELYIDFVAVGQ